MGEQQAEEVSTARRAELAQRLTAVRRRIADACAAAGRGADEPALMAVTKTVAAADVAALLDLGLDLFGENRVQEATRKVEAVAACRPTARPRWHLIGGLQRNKVRAVARWAEWRRHAMLAAERPGEACEDEHEDERQDGERAPRHLPDTARGAPPAPMDRYAFVHPRDATTRLLVL